MTTILLEFAIRTSLIAGGTAAVLWMLRIKTASVRHAAWSAVVVTMLVLPLLLAGRVRMSLPVLTPAPAAAHTATTGASVQSATPVEPPASDTQESMAAHATVAAPASRVLPIDWRLVATGAYAAGALILLLRLVIGTIQANQLRRSAVVHDGRLTSDRCATPITVGWFSQALILPEGWQDWPASKIEAVLTHEGEHARRHDPLVQWLTLLNRAIFWFHPLAWWLERRLATLAEEACDAAVLAAGHSPQDYSEYLLDMARTVTRQHGRVRLVGMAMPGSGLSDRLRLILQGLPDVRVSRRRLVCTIACCAISSVVFAAGSLGERAPQQNAAPPPITFDVVSIKPCPDVASASTGRGAGPNLAQTSPGHVFWACVTLASLVDQAYAGWDFPLLNTQSDPLAFESNRGSARLGDGPGDDGPRRVRGGPSWMYSDRFAIEATASVDTISPPAGAVNLMRLPGPMNQALRAMLADRFQLKVRRATEQLPMYALTVAPGGLKIQPPAPGDCIVYVPGMPRTTPSGTKGYCGGISQTVPLAKLERLNAGQDSATVMAMPGPTNRIEYNGVTLQAVAAQLSKMMDGFVLDKTGVTGEFMFAVEYTKNENTPTPSMGLFVSKDAAQPAPAAKRAGSPSEGREQTIFQALAAVGLKLEPTKGPAEYLVIDSVQKPRPNEPGQAGPGGR